MLRVICFLAAIASASAFSAGGSRLAASRMVVQRVQRSADIQMVKKSVGDLTDAELKGKRVLVRCDLNVPLDGKKITDDTRIRASVPTIKHLMSKGAKVLLSSHLGRPKDGPEDKFSLAPCAVRMSELLGKPVTMAPDCIGDKVAELVSQMKDGDVMLLENVRFYKEEEKNVPAFAEKLAANADLYVNDAFVSCPRSRAFRPQLCPSRKRALVACAADVREYPAPLRSTRARPQDGAADWCCRSLPRRPARPGHGAPRARLDGGRDQVPQAVGRGLPAAEGARLPRGRRPGAQAPLRRHCRWLEGVVQDWRH